MPLPPHILLGSLSPTHPVVCCLRCEQSESASDPEKVKAFAEKHRDCPGKPEV